MIPHTLNIMNQPIPPPIPIDSNRLLSQPCELRIRYTYDEIAISTATIIPSAGPFFSGSAELITTPISMIAASVQINKKLQMARPPLAPPLRASAATIMFQYPNPAKTVTTDDHRNHHIARDISDG